MKYGAAIPQVVDDAVAGLTADCELAPYFAVVGNDRSRLGGSSQELLAAPVHGALRRPGDLSGRERRRGHLRLHDRHPHGLEIPADKFDRFVTDFGAVLKADGVADADITTIATAVMGLQVAGRLQRAGREEHLHRRGGGAMRARILALLGGTCAGLVGA